MRDSAFWISLVAIGIAVWSVILAVRADKRAYRAEHRDERREQREEAEAAARRRGRPVVVPDAVHGGSTANPVRHEYMVRNSGPASITALRLWIENGEGQAVSSVAGGPMVLVSGDSAVAMGVAVPQPLPNPDQTLDLMVRWQDADGEHIERTGIHPRRHA